MAPLKRRKSQSGTETPNTRSKILKALDDTCVPGPDEDISSDDSRNCVDPYLHAVDRDGWNSGVSQLESGCSVGVGQENTEVVNLDMELYVARLFLCTWA